MVANHPSPPLRFAPVTPEAKELERAVAALDPEAEELPREVLDALAAATLLVVVELPEGADIGDPGSMPDGTSVGLAIAEVDGVPHVPAFTGMDRVEESGVGDVPALEITGAELAGGWPVDIPLALNPGCEVGMSIPAEDVRSLAAAGQAGPPARSISAGTEIQVSVPVTEPQRTLERVREAAERTPGVLAAHRALFAAGREAQPQLAIGIELDDGADEAAALKACADAAGPGVALLPVRNPPANPIDAWMAREDAPFYRRAPGS